MEAEVNKQLDASNIIQAVASRSVFGGPQITSASEEQNVASASALREKESQFVCLQSKNPFHFHFGCKSFTSQLACNPPFVRR